MFVTCFLRLTYSRFMNFLIDTLYEKQWQRRICLFWIPKQSAVNQNQREELHKQMFFHLWVTENFQTRTESEQRSCHSQSWKKEDHEKKEKPEKEREKKNIRHACCKGNWSQRHASLDLTMEDWKQIFLHWKIKHKAAKTGWW